MCKINATCFNVLHSTEILKHGIHYCDKAPHMSEHDQQTKQNQDYEVEYCKQWQTF